MCKNKSFFHFVFTKNEPVESTGREAGLPNATSTAVSSQMLMKVRVLKLKSVNSKMSGSQSFCGSLFTITVATLCLLKGRINNTLLSWNEVI
jgi:hypothetical protein